MIMFYTAEINGIKCVPNTPGKRGSSNGAEIKEDVRQFYKDVGLEPDAEQVYSQLLMNVCSHQPVIGHWFLRM